MAAEIPLLNFAHEELARAGYLDNGTTEGKAVLSLLEHKENTGWEGYSIDTIVKLYKQLVRRRPLTPLTGEDSEWRKFTNDLQQNKRCPSIFKDAQGNAWDSEAVVDVTEDGLVFSPGRSYITFPYTPETILRRTTK